MNKLIRGIGSCVLTCVIFACPICFTLLLAFGKAAEHAVLTTTLGAATIGEFVLKAIWLFWEYDEDL